MPQVSELHVVVGADPLGLAVTRALSARGKPVRLVSKSGPVGMLDGVEGAAADIADLAGARQACRGAAVVYHCAMAPYARWPATLPGMMAGIIEGAAAAGARLVCREIPG